MRLTDRVKAINHVKVHAAEGVDHVAESREPFIVTKNGEATAMPQELTSQEATQETLALLRIIALGKEDIAAGRTKSAREVIERLRAKNFVAT